MTEDPAPPRGAVEAQAAAQAAPVRAPVRVAVLVLAFAGATAAALFSQAIGLNDASFCGVGQASPVVFVAALHARWRGALAAAAGGILATLVMRRVARRWLDGSRTREWLCFLAGTAVFALAVAAAHVPLDPGAAALTLAFEPLAVLTGVAVLANLREARTFRRELLRSAAVFGTAAIIVLVVWLLPFGSDAAGGGVGAHAAMLLAIPLSLMIALQRRSLWGAIISLAGCLLALLSVAGGPEGVHEAMHVTVAVYLAVLAVSTQLVHATYRDRLTALEALRAQAGELERRVAERTASLAAMTARAIAADRAKTAFLGTVSHELRTPLNGVIGMASILLAEPLPDDARRHVELIRVLGMHLLDVINRILDFNKLGSDREAGEAAPFDLAALAREVTGEVGFLRPAGEIEIRTELAPGLPATWTAPRRDLRQVLTNLVGNAVKFTDRGSVTLSLRPGAEGGLRIEVRDTGIGIPPAMQARIFEPFVQADASVTRRHGGTGLGLAICAELVRRMGGRIGVTSREGLGATFWVDLPATGQPTLPSAMVNAAAAV